MEIKLLPAGGECPKWPIKTCHNCYHSYAYSCKGDSLECDNAIVCMNWEPEGVAFTDQPPICLHHQGVCSYACLDCERNPNK